MSSRETSITFPPGFTPLERILLTANGNVQRILSAYYNAKIVVKIIKNEKVSAQASVFEREVDLLLQDKVCCKATSVVTISDAKYQRMLVEENIAIGQLFRYLNILPEYELKNVERRENGGFWRQYTLKSPGIVCDILEDFPASVFELEPNS
ncbi:uncharacterized protein EV422DRAFT_589745 [Fimicolochytrium jonesii]|uniref:uncharacterized protein n=1 Tax=Fimicolochytrium jonesii TaxID=1396493 RepID=UPI0022FDFE07|nr:uncharacterized protein EV422DRAFT_589745 [Fimicolochytrium jonesii]KAI8818384.1 hypothetical protein EV422DRAFT_589745 [Fimicolochytrium jonesii]